MDLRTDLLIIQQLCNNLDMQGEKTMVLSLNLSTNSYVTLGCDWGKEFAESHPAFRHEYQQYCEEKARIVYKSGSSYYEEMVHEENGNNDAGQPFPTATQQPGGPFSTADKYTGEPFPTADKYTDGPYPTADKQSGGPFPTADKYTGEPFPTADNYTGEPFPTATKYPDGRFPTTTKYPDGPFPTSNEDYGRNSVLAADDNVDNSFSSEDALGGVNDETNGEIKQNASTCIKADKLTQHDGSIEIDDTMGLHHTSPNIKEDTTVPQLVNETTDETGASSDEDSVLFIKSDDKIIDDIDEPSPELKGKSEAKCDACGMTFKHKWSLQRHVQAGRCHVLNERKKTVAAKFHCDSCRKPFHHVKSLQRHIRDGRCHNPSDKQKNVRQKLLKQKQIYIDKKATRDPQKDVQCKICGKVLSTKTNVTQHIKLFHNKERNHVCHVCGSAFPVKHTLDIHLRKHTGDLPFKCSFCGKGYRSKDSCGKHESSEHHNHRPYVCHICGKSYRQSGHLGIHQKRHNTEYKPVTCVHCPEKFRSYFALRRHILHEHKMEDFISKESKLYYCDMCPKVFSDKKYIESHRNSHLGLKPHKCGVCQKAFSDKSNLRQHQATHDDKEIECSLCFMRFSLPRSLKSHKLTVHNVKALEMQPGPY